MKLKKGTTLIELLIVIIILTILMTAFSSIYVNGIKSSREEFIQTQLQSDAQTILDRITGDIKLAQGVDANYNTFVTSENTIILKVPAIDQSQNFLYTGTDLLLDRIIYYKHNSELHRVVYANMASIRYPSNNTNRILSDKVSIFTPTYQPDMINPVTVTTTLKLSKAVGKVNKFITVVGKAKLRNNL